MGEIDNLKRRIQDARTDSLFPAIFDGCAEIEAVAQGENKLIKGIAGAIQTLFDNRNLTTLTGKAIGEFEVHFGITGAETKTLEERRNEIIRIIRHTARFNEADLLEYVQSLPGGETIDLDIDSKTLILNVFTEVNNEDEEEAQVVINAADKIRPLIPQNIELHASVKAAFDEYLIANYGYDVTFCASMGRVHYYPAAIIPEQEQTDVVTFVKAIRKSFQCSLTEANDIRKLFDTGDFAGIGGIMEFADAQTIADRWNDPTINTDLDTTGRVYIYKYFEPEAIYSNYGMMDSEEDSDGGLVEFGEINGGMSVLHKQPLEEQPIGEFGSMDTIGPEPEPITYTGSGTLGSSYQSVTIGGVTKYVWPCTIIGFNTTQVASFDSFPSEISAGGTICTKVSSYSEMPSSNGTYRYFAVKQGEQWIIYFGRGTALNNKSFSFDVTISGNTPLLLSDEPDPEIIIND